MRRDETAPGAFPEERIRAAGFWTSWPNDDNSWVEPNGGHVMTRLECLDTFRRFYDETDCPLCDRPSLRGAICRKCSGLVEHARHTVRKAARGQVFVVTERGGYSLIPGSFTTRKDRSMLGHGGATLTFSQGEKRIASDDVWCFISSSLTDRQIERLLAEVPELSRWVYESWKS